MAEKTIHVYPSDGAWTVRKNGSRPKSFGTQREAIEVARRDGKKARVAQIAVHGKDGRLLAYRTYGMPKVQNPPRSSRIGNRKIAKAVGKVVLDRLRSDIQLPRASTPSK